MPHHSFPLRSSQHYENNVDQKSDIIVHSQERLSEWGQMSPNLKLRGTISWSE